MVARVSNQPHYKAFIGRLPASHIEISTNQSPWVLVYPTHEGRLSTPSILSLCIAILAQQSCLSSLVVQIRSQPSALLTPSDTIDPLIPIWLPIWGLLGHKIALVPTPASKAPTHHQPTRMRAPCTSTEACLLFKDTKDHVRFNTKTVAKQVLLFEKLSNGNPHGQNRVPRDLAAWIDPANIRAIALLEAFNWDLVLIRVSFVMGNWIPQSTTPSQPSKTVPFLAHKPAIDAYKRLGVIVLKVTVWVLKVYTQVQYQNTPSQLYKLDQAKMSLVYTVNSPIGYSNK
ncbi:hypothetical protein G9A89_000373 [Geosiphon pyriformis]|nr:hypothetical protein G9A89_000373 [Geosiphon pyriformis]